MKDNRFIPHYNQDKSCWAVEFPNRATEEGDLLYVTCEYLRTSLYYPYNTGETKGKEFHGHSHSIDSVIGAVLHDPEGFTIDGFEKYYSQQERELLLNLQEKLKQEYDGLK